MFSSLPSSYENQILCYYVNSSKQIQIIRITNIPNWYFEKVVFPQQGLMFEALPEAVLEIYTGVMPTGLLSDKIWCHQLQVQEEMNCIPIQDRTKEQYTRRAS